MIVKKQIGNILCFIVMGCTANTYTESHLRSILGVNVQVENVIYSNEDWGGLRGDGFSLVVLALSDESIQKFVKNQDKNYYPELNRDGNWMVYPWALTPIEEKYKEVKSMLIGHYTSDSKQIEINRKVKSLLDDNKNYYAFYSKGELEYVHLIEFFLLDVSNHQLYVFKIQT